MGKTLGMHALHPRRPVRPLITLALAASLATGCGLTDVANRGSGKAGDSGVVVMNDEQAAKALIAQDNLGPNWETAAFEGHYEPGCLVNAADPLDYLPRQEVRVDFQHVDEWPNASNAVWMATTEEETKAAFAEIRGAIRRCTEIKMNDRGWRIELKVAPTPLVDDTDADDQVTYQAYGTATSPDDEVYDAYYRGTFLRHGAAATAIFTQDAWDSPLHETLVRLASKRLVAVMAGEDPPTDQIDKSGQA